MGVDTSYMEALQRAELEALSRRNTGSPGGDGEPDAGGGLTPEQQAAMDAFQNGDHSDGVIEALVQAGYTQAQLEAAGYTGDYFRDGGDYKTLKYRDLSDRGKQIADLIDSDGTTDYARAIDLIEALPTRTSRTTCSDCWKATCKEDAMANNNIQARLADLRQRNAARTGRDGRSLPGAGRPAGASRTALRSCGRGTHSGR